MAPYLKATEATPDPQNAASEAELKQATSKIDLAQAPDIPFHNKVSVLQGLT